MRVNEHSFTKMEEFLHQTKDAVKKFVYSEDERSVTTEVNIRYLMSKNMDGLTHDITHLGAPPNHHLMEARNG